MAGQGGGFLPEMTAAFVELQKSETLPTLPFVTACEKVTPFFDHIGRLFEASACLHPEIRAADIRLI